MENILSEVGPEPVWAAAHLPTRYSAGPALQRLQLHLKGTKPPSLQSLWVQNVIKNSWRSRLVTYGGQNHRFKAVKDDKQQVKDLEENMDNEVNEQKEEKPRLSTSSTGVLLHLTACFIQARLRFSYEFPGF